MTTWTNDDELEERRERWASNPPRVFVRTEDQNPEPMYVGEDNEVVKSAPIKPRYNNSQMLFTCLLDFVLAGILIAGVAMLVVHLRGGG
jgi:hypothetical protein